MERAVFGRAAELAAISNFLDELPSGPIALTLHGEAGIGKTALWREALAQARSRSYRVVWCQPAATEANLSFAALTDLLDDVPEEGFARLPPPQRTAIEVATLRREAESPPDQRTISSAFRGTLLALAASNPVVVAVDDAQWLDVPSARVLEFAMRRSWDAPIGFILAMGSEGHGSALASLDRVLPRERVRELRLAPLGLDTIREVLTANLSIPFPDSVLLRINEACAGNPFFALELGREVLRRGTGPGRGGTLPVPATLANLVRDRLATLSGSVREALLIVAAAYSPTVPLIAGALGSPAVYDDISTAARAGVVFLSGGRIRFSHPLLGTLHYSESSDRARRDAHRRLAAVVVEEEERARHLALASEGPDQDVAEALENAAHRARWRGAPEVAAELSELSLELTPLQRHEDRARRTMRSGQYAFEAAEVERAAALLGEAAEMMPGGPQRAEALLHLSRVRYHSHDARSARALAQEALAQAGDAAGLKTEIEMELAAAAEASGDHSRAMAHARTALALAEDQGDERALSEALALAGLYRFLSGERGSHEMMNRAVALEEAGGEARPLRSARFFRACTLMWMDDLDGARSTFAELEKHCREGGDESSLSVTLFLLSQLECWAGDWRAAESYADESCAITSWTGQQVYRAFALFAKALVAGHKGDVEEARSSAQEGLTCARRTGSAQGSQLNRSVLGFVELSLGDMKGANRHLWPLAKELRATGIGEPGVLRFLPDAIEALISVGELHQAEPFLGRFLERAEALDRTWALATGERCRGLLAQAKGDVPSAHAAFDRAVEKHRTLDEPFELGRTLLARGQALRRAKQWGKARASLEGSLEVFERLGAGLWARKARGELSRIGGRAPSPLELTATEQRVAERAASGLTNREIATELFLSVSAVEANLRRAYRKLGIRSRTELARVLTPD